MAGNSEGFEEFGERALHTRRKGLQEREEESNEAAVQRERFVGSTFCIF